MSSPRDFDHDGRYHQHQSSNGSETYPVGTDRHSETDPQYAPPPLPVVQAQRCDIPNAQQPVNPYPWYFSATPSPPRSRHADFLQLRSIEPQGQDDNVATVRSQAHMPHPNYVPLRPPSHLPSHATDAGPDYLILDSPPLRNPSQSRVVPVRTILSTDGPHYSMVPIGRVRRPVTTLDDKTLRGTSADHQRAVSGVVELDNELRQEPDNDDDEDNDLDDYALMGSIHSDSGRSDYYPSVPSREHGHAVSKERSAFDVKEASWSFFR